MLSRYSANARPAGGADERDMGDDGATTRVSLALGPDAFLLQVEGVLDPAYRLATVILLDYAAAEDAVHDAALHAWRQYDRLSGDGIGFRTWFLAILASRCRSRRRWRRLTLRRRSIRRVGGPRDVLLRLPLASRIALFCHVSLDLPDDEVARVLHTSPARARRWISSAGWRVEADLGRGDEGGEP